MKRVGYLLIIFIVLFSSGSIVTAEMPETLNDVNSICNAPKNVTSKQLSTSKQTNGKLKDTIFTSAAVRKLQSIKINQKLTHSYNPVTLTVTASYNNKSTVVVKSGVTWKSDNTKVATVNSKGVVTFTGNSGTVSVTATYQGKTAKVTTKVGNVLKSLTPNTKLAYSTKPVTITLTAIYSNGKKETIKKGINWKSSNLKVAKVSTNGVVTFTGQNGDVTITATYQGKTVTLITKVNQSTSESAVGGQYAGSIKLGKNFKFTLSKDGRQVTDISANVLEYCGGSTTSSWTQVYFAGPFEVKADGTVSVEGKEKHVQLTLTYTFTATFDSKGHATGTLRQATVITGYVCDTYKLDWEATKQ